MEKTGVAIGIAKAMELRIRIGQQNVQGCRAYLEDINETITEQKRDVMLSQEPYSYRGIIPNVGGTKIIEGNPKAATLVYNE